MSSATYQSEGWLSKQQGSCLLLDDSRLDSLFVVRRVVGRARHVAIGMYECKIDFPM